jgi:hypothetical protein
MLAIELKNYLSKFSNETNVMIFVSKNKETRQLLMSDLNVNYNGNIVVNSEYDVPIKYTIIERG